MFAKERRDQIVQTVNEEGRATVGDLVKRFGVTEDCIRKDLKLLDSQGLLRRVYGGAMSLTQTPELYVERRLDDNLRQKQAIARKAYELIRPGETLFLDVSTTNLALADLIATGNKQVMVVSNMLNVLHRLADCPTVKVLGTGGLVDAKLNGFSGTIALQMLESFRFDRAFLGAFAVNEDTGEAFTYDPDDGAIKRQALQTSSHAVLVAEERKFGGSSSFCFARLEELDAVVCDNPRPDLARKLEGFGCDLL